MRTIEEARSAQKAARDKYKASPKYREWLSNYLSKGDVKVKHAVSSKRWRAKPGSVEKMRPAKWKFNLMDKYGITVGQYNSMLASQGGVCAICGGVNSNGRRLHVDHNHATGKIRGLLCHGCNASIGLLKEDPVRASKMVEYLRK
jgi:hypothetical protein